MASISSDPRGRKRILFFNENGDRKALRLGKCSLRQAEALKVKLESLISSRMATGILDDETGRWVAQLGDDLHAKLAAVGLVQPRASLQLGEFLRQYLEGRSDIKPGSVLVLRQAQQSLVNFFGADKPLREITESDAELWRLSMTQEGLAAATISARCGDAKQFFRQAVRQKLVPSNPFGELNSSVKGNDKRLYFVKLQDAQKVLDACPDTQWRLIFALCRFGGLRCPSEVLTLKWGDVNWEKARMLVHSPKTERHEGKESRCVPIFPELYPHLLAAYEQAEPGPEYVVTRYRQCSANLRTELRRIIHRAGLKAWPRTFQNLRASRETELCESFPLHVVTAWLGNTQTVAMKHYLSVREEDFARAAQNPAHSERGAQNAAQQPAAMDRKDSQANREDSPENAGLLVGAVSCDSLHESPIAPRGFEPLLPG